MNRVMAALAICLLTLAGTEARTWTEEASGRELEAEFVSSNGESVELRRGTDGKRFTIPVAKLSEADREFVAQQEAGGSGGGGLPKAKEDRFKDLEWKSVEEIPVTGDSHERFEGVDRAILEFMAERGIGALVAAVSREGEIEYDRAFGFQDAKLKNPLQQGTTMRLASISKPLTAAVAKTMLRDKKMNIDDKVFDLLGLADVAPKDVDDRWKEVTIGHLLEHEGGWDRDVSGDPAFKAGEISEDMKVDIDELVFDEVVEWMLERPLDFDPGSRDSYSNFGYTLLARTAEEVSGVSWGELLTASIAKEAEMSTLVVSPTEVENRVAGEIWYHYHPEYEEDPDPMTFRMEISFGSGALACSAADLCRFLETYWISGEPREGNGYIYSFHGSMPGTSTVSAQRKDGVSFAVLVNRRDKSGSDWNDELKKAVNSALDGVKW